jgi:hypothetical protein
MSNNDVIITREQHPDIYEWLFKNTKNNIMYHDLYTLTSEGKINAYCEVYLYDYVKQIKHPFSYVKGDFSCRGCENLTSIINSPEKVGGSFHCGGFHSLTSFKGFPKHIKGYITFSNNLFSNNPKYKEQYKLYLAMWLELLESVNNEERLEYITNYKDKVDSDSNKPIIPIEILKEYGF